MFTIVRSRHSFRLKCSWVTRPLLSDGCRQSSSTTRELVRAEPNNMKKGTLWWRQMAPYASVSEQDFLTYAWQMKHSIDRQVRLYHFLKQVVPARIPGAQTNTGFPQSYIDCDHFLADVAAGFGKAPMAVRVTPYILSLIDWKDPLHDPLRRQFIPVASALKDSEDTRYDSLHEEDDSPVPGIVHRYPDKVLFLATSICPTYCRFCTRSYAVGAATPEKPDKATKRPGFKRWGPMLAYIERSSQIHDVVVSGGDAFYLSPDMLQDICDRLLAIPHIQRIRLASKGLAVCPSRFLDPTDLWAPTLIQLSQKAREQNKTIALHTHVNHPNEITWITTEASRKLARSGVTVRNQAVLLKGVNDSLETMSTLTQTMAANSIQPYYVYQGDMVNGVEDLRTPLRVALNLDKALQGTIAGFMLPKFVVDLPGGGGKRSIHSYETYDERTGVSTWTAPGVKAGQTFVYHDPKPDQRGQALQAARPNE